MPYCSHCGAELGLREKVCRECGTNRASASWALATELCECSEPTARGWRFCIHCGRPTAVYARGRSVKVEASQIESWFADLEPVDEPSPVVTRAESPELPRPTTQPTVERSTPRRRAVYTSAAYAAGTAQRILLGTALIALIAAATLWVLNSRLNEFKAGAPDTYDAAVSVASLADWGARPLTLLGIGASVWFLMRWTVIVYGNILSFGRTSLRLPPSAVPWAFFIPVLNFFAPQRLINDAWRAADEGRHAGQDWMLQRGNRWTAIAWSMGVASAIFHIIGWRAGNDTVDAAITANRWALLGYVATAAAMGATVMMVQRITDRQERRDSELDARTV